MHAAVWVGLGGMAGALARFYLGLALTARFGPGLPVATFVINLTGCLLLGFVATIGAERLSIATPELRLLLGVGFCGAYTTFSTFSLETLMLLRAGAIAPALGYVLASNVLGLAAVALGAWLAQAR